MTDRVEAWLDKARMLHQQGDLASALPLYEKVVKKRPKDARALFMLGTVKAQMGDPQAAVPLLKKAAALSPGNAGVHTNLGNVLRATGDLAGAENCYRQAIRIQPNQPLPHSNLGNIHLACGRLDEAVACFNTALRLHPDDLDATLNLGVAKKEMGEMDAAESMFKKCLALAPDHPQAHINLANLHSMHSRIAEAEVHYRKAIEVSPGYVEAYYNLGINLHDVGKLEESEACYLKGQSLDPHHTKINLNLMLLQNYLPDKEPGEIHRMHKAWGDRFVAALGKQKPPRFANTKEPDRPLRVGYLSPDFRTHQVADFVELLIAHHDPTQVLPICYSHVAHPDAVTDRFRSAAWKWRDVVGRTDREIAEWIRKDKVDILVDLAGHTLNSRVTVLALRPAPIQAVYLGYPATTGLPGVDFRFTDNWGDPPSSDGYYTETLVRLDDGFCCWRPPDDAPAVAPAPFVRERHISFGCMLPLIKINSQVVHLWEQVLDAVPDSRLVVFRDKLTEPEVRDRYLGLLTDGGIAEERITLVGGEVKGKSHLAEYGRFDIVLDTLPYAGHTTTCEALWMGVPVMTLAGNRFAGRMGASLMHMVGLPELVAESPEQYVETAATLAGDPERLVALRAGMRERLSASPLMDGAAFARKMENAYRSLWKAWCDA